jgi:hypothetical protein
MHYSWLSGRERERSAWRGVATGTGLLRERGPRDGECEDEKKVSYFRRHDTKMHLR